MKGLALAAIAGLAGLACAAHAAAAAPGPARRAELLKERPYALVVPPGLDAARPAPLVLLLHGYGASGAWVDGWLGLSAAAARHGVLVALPEGSRDRGGRRFWNATDACCDLFAARVDDVEYLLAVLDDVASRRAVDPRRVFVVGHSNGGFMAHRLACEAADRIAAFVSVAGHGWKEPGRCRPSAPVAALQIHGDRDRTIPYGGGAVRSPRGEEGPPLPSARESVGRWAELDGCAGALEPAGELDLERELPGAETRVERHACARGAAELWTVRGGGHVPALRRPEAAEAVLGWLLAHPKP